MRDASLQRADPLLRHGDASLQRADPLLRHGDATLGRVNRILRVSRGAIPRVNRLLGVSRRPLRARDRTLPCSVEPLAAANTVPPRVRCPLGLGDQPFRGASAALRPTAGGTPRKAAASPAKRSGVQRRRGRHRLRRARRSSDARALVRVRVLGHRHDTAALNNERFVPRVRWASHEPHRLTAHGSARRLQRPRHNRSGAHTPH